MVSTRQMTGATSDETNLNFCRAVPASSCSTSTNTSSNVASIGSSISTKAVTGFPQHITNSVSSSGVLTPVFKADGITPGMVVIDQQGQRHHGINLMDLPTELLGHIFSYVGYKKIAHMRVISRQMNKILDEVYSVLNYIRTSPSLDRPFKVTDELFDLSTMAMEYFKEHIEPNLPDIAYFTNSTKSFAALETSSSILSRDTSHSNSSSPPQSNMVLRKGIRKIKQGMKRYNNQLTFLRSELRTCKRKATEQAKTITEQQKLLAEQQKQTLEFANRLDETDKKNDELSRKFSTVLQELNKCKTELQYWRSKSPATTNCNPYGQVVPSYDLQNLGSQSTVSYDIDLLSMGITRSAAFAIVEDTRKRDDSEQNKEKVECISSLVKIEGDSAALSESAESLPAILTKTGIKRKLECLPLAIESNNSDGISGNEPVPLDGLACLNPPFASASLTASSANAPEQMNVIQGCSSTNHDVGSYGTNLSFASENPLFNNPKAIHQSNTNHILNQNSDSKNNSSSLSSNVDSKNDSTSNDNNTNNHMKKIRRVQNKARSQSYNKHSNLSTTINTHTKTTRSKQLDRPTGN
uniref:F-box domain-containing protein n=1 Tax=Anopheles christyi TaxID=43041 RepID=A0A182JPK9_9DIPT